MLYSYAMERRRTAIVLSPAIRKESRGTGSPAGADAGFRVRGGASGVSRISARGVLKVRPHTKSGGGGGGGGEGTIRFRSNTKSGGGGGGGQFTSGPIRKVGGGGGNHSASGPIPLFGTQRISTCTYLRAT